MSGAWKPALLAGAFGLGVLPGAVGGQIEAEEGPALPEPGGRTDEGGPLEEPAYSSTTELLRAIAEGSFVPRGGLPELPDPVPEPVVVAFVSGTNVPDEEVARLEALARRLEADASLHVDILGCSDPSGPAGLNLRISRSRASSVAAELKRLGVEEERFGEVIGKGEDCEVQERVVHVTPRRREEPTPP